MLDLLHLLGRAVMAVRLVALFELLVDVPVVVEGGVLLLREHDAAARQLGVLEVLLLLLLLVGLHLLLVLAFLLVSGDLADLEQVVELVGVLVVLHLSAHDVLALESAHLVVDDLAELAAHPLHVAALHGVVSLLLLPLDFDLVALLPVELVDLLLLLEVLLFEHLLLLDQSLLLLSHHLLVGALLLPQGLLLDLLLLLLLDLQQLHLLLQFGLLLEVELPLLLLALLQESLLLAFLRLLLGLLEPLLLVPFLLQPDLPLALLLGKPFLFPLPFFLLPLLLFPLQALLLFLQLLLAELLLELGDLSLLLGLLLLLDFALPFFFAFGSGSTLLFLVNLFFNFTDSLDVCPLLGQVLLKAHLLLHVVVGLGHFAFNPVELLLAPRHLRDWLRHFRFDESFWLEDRLRFLEILQRLFQLCEYLCVFLFFFLFLFDDFSRSLWLLRVELVGVLKILALIEDEDLVDLDGSLGSRLRRLMVRLLADFPEPGLPWLRLGTLSLFFTRFLDFGDVLAHSVLAHELLALLTGLLVLDLDDFLGVFDCDGLLGALLHAHVLDVQDGVAGLLGRLLLGLVLRVPPGLLPLLAVLVGLLVVVVHLLLGVALFLPNVSVLLGALDELVVLRRLGGRGVLV